MKIRYQAVILIGVVALSLYAFKDPSALSHNLFGSKKEAPTSVPADAYDRSVVSPQKGGDALRMPQQSVTDPSRSSASSERPSIGGGEESPCPSVEAKIYLARDLHAGSSIMEKEASHQWPIASISKLMTAIVALENIPATTPVSITESVIEASEGYSSFSTGESYSARDMIRAALVFSSNDATFGLADTLGRDAFVGKMNEKAKSLGMYHTTFRDPSGLSYLNQSTADDLALLMEYIYENHPEIFSITREKTVSLRELNSGKARTFNNIDYFAGSKGFIGGKTGYIDQSGENLVTMFNQNGTPRILVVLSSPDRFGETQKLLSCSNAASR
jgi:D-alanyl-D-alanine endopeptidase (penicillin-binding protein 7)